MTVQFTELIGSKSFSMDSSKKSGDRKFLILDDENPFTIFDARREAASQGFKIGALFPGDATLKVISMDFSPHSDRVGTFEFSVSYESGDPDEDDGGEFEEGPVSQNVGTRVELVDVWRTNPDPDVAEVGQDVSGANVDGDDSVGEDVKGSSSDTAGSPLSLPLALLDLTLTENTTTGPDFIELSDFIGTRNKQSFAGAPKGSVIYKGSSSTFNRNGLYTVTHQFTADFTFKHRRQMAVGDPSTGAPELADENTANGNSSAAAALAADDETPPGSGTTTKGSAKKVVWVQRFKRLTNFDDITEFDHFEPAPPPS